MTGPDNPTEKIRFLLGKDANKMDQYIAHLTNLMTGFIDCLLYRARDIQSWKRRHQWMLWLDYDRKPSVGNGQKMMLQSIIEKPWIA